jgi:hypothetical protein
MARLVVSLEPPSSQKMVLNVKQFLQNKFQSFGVCSDIDIDLDGERERERVCVCVCVYVCVCVVSIELMY